jgi:hypothetical protein
MDARWRDEAISGRRDGFGAPARQAGRCDRAAAGAIGWTRPPCRSCAAATVWLKLHSLANNLGESGVTPQPAWLPLQQALAGTATLTIARDPASDAQRITTTARRAFLNMSLS